MNLARIASIFILLVATTDGQTTIKENQPINYRESLQDKGSSDQINKIYSEFERCLIASSNEVNKYLFTDVIYNINEQDARYCFQKYFTSNFLTHSLRANLGYPLFFWGNNHQSLQKGMIDAITASLSKSFNEFGSPDLIEAAMAKNPLLHDHIFESLCFLYCISENSKVMNSVQFQDIHKHLIDILRSSNFFPNGYLMRDPEKYVYSNTIATQLLMTIYKYSLITNNINSFSKITLPDKSRSRLLNNGVCLLDNCNFDRKQLLALAEIVEAIPESNHVSLTVSCMDFILSPRNQRVNVHRFNGGVNIFGPKVGAHEAREFPVDYPNAAVSDGFCIIFSHEYAHALDGNMQRKNLRWNTYRSACLNMAGADKRNYLRSMFDDKFFTENPQEFIASIANQYFACSDDLLYYSLVKAKQGNMNQINQFVLFASMISERDRLPLIQISKDGRVAKRNVAITKNDGLITSMVWRNYRYVFTFGSGGTIEHIERTHD